MVDPVVFGGMLADIHAASDPRESIECLVEVARIVSDGDAAGVMLVRSGGTIETAAFSDATVRRADELQISLRQGPCLSARGGGDHFRIDDTLTDERWPDWSAGAAELGIRSVLSSCLVSEDGAKPVGSLLVYSRRVSAFDDDHVALMRVLAQHAAITVRKLHTIASSQRAIDNRTAIGQAQGIIMSTYRVNADEAFAVLVRYSQRRNQPLREVAGLVIDQRCLPADDVSSVFGSERT